MKKALQTLFILIFTVTAVTGQDVIYTINGESDNNTAHHRKPSNMGFLQAVHLKSSQTIKHQLDSSVFREWNDTTKVWTNYSKRVNMYNANGNNTQSIGYVWVNATGSWIPNWKSEISYNEKQIASQELAFDWDRTISQWIPDFKDVYYYNTDGTMSQILQHDWDIKTSQWVLLWKSIYSYNSNGDLTLILDYNRDESTDLWELIWKYIYSYNIEKQTTQYLEYFLDEKTSEWVADSKIEYFYDDNDNLTEYQVYNRNKETNQLELDWKREYTYDNRYSHSDLVSYLSSFSQNHMLTGQLTSMWNKSNNSWDNPIYNSIFYYSELNTTSVSSIKLKLAEIYPNPASEHINFHFTGTNQAKFELFDLQGRMVLSENVLNGGKLDVQQLTNGVYFYNIFTDENRQSGKLIRQ